jgi:hypothetical protein
MTAADQRVGDVTAVLNLAHQLICGGPDGKPPPGAGVTVGVAGQLTRPGQCLWPW